MNNKQVNAFVNISVVIYQIYTCFWSFWVEANLCRFYRLSFVYKCIVIGDPIIKRGRVGVPLTCLTLPHICPKPGLEFTKSYGVVFFFYDQW